MAGEKTDVKLTHAEQCIKDLVATFYDCSRKDKDQENLSLEEFRELVKKNFPNYLKGVNLEEKIKELDTNNDKQMKFSEFLKLIGELVKTVKRCEKAKHTC
ncbi:protein S100-A13 [Xenopus laevis]|uniref:protein S100-A13 n=2 Tax=Xenopus laevis TaxID=8355 RepID=A0A1L8FD91_XENLA|nr:protein S100-A13 [Xenopus laevis]XP_018087233.1 protein S100-A13 [Xenopus laevis]OCT69543.1 hypothetical protein XELAEV_18040854mg [Xenopus laevis]